MNIKLYAVGDYPDIELNFKKEELINCQNIYAKLKSFTSGYVIRAKMAKTVIIDPVDIGEILDLRKRCEVKNKMYAFGADIRKINELDVENKRLKITQTDGEKQILPREKLQDLYKMVDKYKSEYVPIDEYKSYTKITKNVYFKTPWGEIVFAPKNSMLCIEYVATREFYVITNSTYDSLFTEEGRKIKLSEYLKSIELEQN